MSARVIRFPAPLRSDRNEEISKDIFAAIHNGMGVDGHDVAAAFISKWEDASPAELSAAFELSVKVIRQFEWLALWKLDGTDGGAA
jgi:hypothetical protein